MAKAAARKTSAPAAVALPQGYREVRSQRFIGSFFTFTQKGDSIEGLLVGTTPIENRKGQKIDRYVLLDHDGNVWILPDHYDLTDKLRTLEEGSQVFLAFVDDPTVTTKRFPRGQKIMKYAVASKPPDAGSRAMVAKVKAGEVGQTPAEEPTAEDDGDVPF